MTFYRCRIILTLPELGGRVPCEHMTGEDRLDFRVLALDFTEEVSSRPARLVTPGLTVVREKELWVLFAKLPVNTENLTYPGLVLVTPT